MHKNEIRVLMDLHKLLALKVIKREFSPVDYVRFLSAISTRRGDAAKELRKLRDVVTEEELDKALKKKGANCLKAQLAGL